MQGLSLARMFLSNNGQASFTQTLVSKFSEEVVRGSLR